MKRFLSLLLALTLVIALLPAAFASEGEGEAATEFTGYTYKFIKSAHEDTNGSFGAGRQMISNTVTSVSDPWGFVALSQSDSGSSQLDDSNMRFTTYKPGKLTAPAATFSPDMTATAHAMCLELQVTTGGKFIPILENERHNYGSILEVYLVPKNEAGTITNLSGFVKGLDPKFRLGVLDFYTVSGSTKMRPVELEDNTDCYLIFVINGENAAATAFNKNFHYNIIESFTLQPRVAEPVSYVYDFSTNQTTGGVDIDTDGDGADTGLAIDPNVTSASTSGSSTVGAWNNNGNYYLYNAAVGRFMTDEYKYINTANSGKWAFAAVRNQSQHYVDKSGLRMTTGYDGAWLGVKIYVDEPDTYRFYFNRNTSGATQPLIDFSFFSSNTFATDSATVRTNTINANKIGTQLDFSETDGETYVANVECTTPGEYYVMWSYTRKDKVVVGTQMARVRLESTTKTSYPAGVGDEYVNVDPENAEAEDRATATAVISASSVTTENDHVGAEITEGEGYIEAPEFAGENDEYKFLYWTKGIGDNRKIVSSERKYTVDATPGNNIFFAVYRDTTAPAAAKATYYNANGDVLGTSAIEDGKTTTLALTNVSLPGFGKADGWMRADDEAVYEGAAEVSVSNGASFVAYYAEEASTVTITTEEDVTVAIEGGKDTASYGDKVTVTAPLRRNNTKLFNYWKKGDEIVSFDRTYEFVAYGDCTLTAVYSDYAPVADTVRKIILGKIIKDGETTVVAEFIGLDNALERGIAFGISGVAASVNSTNRVVMNRKDLNHLAAIDDIGAGYVGYAIMSNGDVYYSK